MKTVLAPIDFSLVSRRVVDEAISVARAIGGRLVLLNVITPLPVLSESAEGEPEGFTTRAEKNAASRLAELQKQLRDEGVTAHAVHRIGPAGERILEQAERLEANYIVMGSHGHGAFYDLIVGSTTMRVLKQAVCPVVIVPPANRISRLPKELASEGPLTVNV